MSTHAGPREGVATEVERVDLARWQADPSPWREQRRPVVLAGAFADTVAVATWTPDNLAQRYPDMEANVSYRVADSAGGPARMKHEMMPVARFVPLLRGEEPCRMMADSLRDTVDLCNEVDLSRAATPPYITVNLWIGKWTRTSLHFDLAENVFVQVRGTKRFLVEPPTSTAGLYMHGGEAAHFSRVDPLAPDPVRFPDYHPGLQQEAQVEAGDALYLPPGWFHHVTSLDTSISVNCWYGNRAS